MIRQCTMFLSAFALLLTSTAAQAQDRTNEPGRVRLYGGPSFGFGGEVEIDGDLPLGIDGDLEDDLVTTFGFQLGADFVLHKYFALGLEYRFAGVNSEQGDDEDDDRSKLFDIALKPRGRYAFDNLPLELYLTVPVGITIPRLSDDLKRIGPIALDLDERVGWNLGVGAGATYFVTRRIGLNLEPIWLMHKFKADGPFNSEAEFKLRQFSLLLNVQFAL